MPDEVSWQCFTASSTTPSLLACWGPELRNIECRLFFLHNTPPSCSIYSVLHPTPPCFATIMTQFPLWHACPSGINKVNLMLPYLILPWIPASLRHATFAIWGLNIGGLVLVAAVAICFNKSKFQDSWGVKFSFASLTEGALISLGLWVCASHRASSPSVRQLFILQNFAFFS